MRIIFDGKILDDRFLQRVEHTTSETEGKTDVVASTGGEEQIVLKTLDTEQEAIDYINGLGDKLAAMNADAVIDARA